MHPRHASISNRKLHHAVRLTGGSAQDWCSAAIAPPGSDGHAAVGFVGRTCPSLTSRLIRTASGERSVATVPAPVKTLADAIEVAVVSGTTSVEAVVDAIATAVESVLGTVAPVVEAHRAALVAVRRRTLGQDIEAAIDALAAAVEPMVDVVAAPVEAVLDAIATAVESVLDTITEIGEGGRRYEQNTQQAGGKQDGTQRSRVVHGHLLTFNHPGWGFRVALAVTTRPLPPG